MGFKDTKQRVLKALRTGNFLHAARSSIDEKNLLMTGEATPEQIAKVIEKCSGHDHESRPHASISVQVDVHILKKDGWYIKFYFIDPDTFFISAHK